MTAFLKQLRQVWLAWANWPVFRVMFWVMALQWFAVWCQVRLGMFYDFGGYRGNTFEFNWWWTHGIEGLLDFCDHVIPVLLVPAVPLMIGWKLRKEMADWRSALAPRFRFLHLLVAAVIGAAILLVMAVAPAALALMQRYASTWQWNWGNAPVYYHGKQFVAFVDSISGNRLHFFDEVHGIDLRIYSAHFMHYDFWPAMAQMSWLLLTVTCIAWVAASVSSWVGLVVLLFAAAPLLGYGYNFYFFRLLAPVDYDRGRSFVDPGAVFGGPVLLLFAFDGLLLALLWRRLYLMPVGLDSVRADERVPWLSGMLVGLKRQPPGGLMNAGIWRRAAHRRAMGLGRRFIWLVAVFTAALILCSPLSYSSQQWFVHGDFAFAAILTASLISVLALGLSWPQRFAELSEIELLRPAPRNQCAREIGLAMLYDAVELAVATLGTMCVVIAIWSPSIFSTWMFWNTLAAAVLSQVLTFGLLASAMLEQSTIASMIAVVLSTLALLILMFEANWLAPSIAAAAIGVILTVHAYRRWLLAETNT